MSLRLMLFALFACANGLEAYAQTSQTQLLMPPPDLLSDVPADFPRFEFAGHEEDAQSLGKYLWFHFSKRLGNGKTLFNHEYLTTSDMWMGGAIDPARGKTIQEVHREDLLAVAIDDEGYVHTHQHISVAHDLGWPFPFWQQGAPGTTAAWNFNNSKPDYMWMIGSDMQGWGDKAIDGWELEQVESLGIVDNSWKLRATGDSPRITTPAGTSFEAEAAPFLQLRWLRSGTPKNHQLPTLEWMREGDADFSPERRAYIPIENGEADYKRITHMGHSIIDLSRHPLWNGRIVRLRLSLAPGESDVEFTLHQLFTVFDTRHTINNPVLILSCWEYFRWTGDIDFLNKQINRLRAALRYQQIEMHGLELNHIRNTWVGHDGIAGWVKDAQGKITEARSGHGIGSNYWDLLPFGWDDFYATYQYYAATLAMARIEELVRAHPGWGLPLGSAALDPTMLREHAQKVRETSQRLFWSQKNQRFIPSIDKNGEIHDYGFTFVNLDAIWYGIASPQQGAAILDWLDGQRIIDGDTSQGEDIYHWEFGPRATTRRNIAWYQFAWNAPEVIPWGGQVQDGGAVLGFSFYDLWARLKLKGPDDAWRRLSQIMAWERKVDAEGGYREYYKDGKRGTTLQGCNTAGGLGIDCEFYESSLIPTIAVRGFLGIEPDGEALVINPRLPAGVPTLGVSNVLYHNVRLDVKAEANQLSVGLKDKPAEPLAFRFGRGSQVTAPDGSVQDGEFVRLDQTGIYRVAY